MKRQKIIHFTKNYGRQEETAENIKIWTKLSRRYTAKFYFRMIIYHIFSMSSVHFTILSGNC